MKVSRTTWSVLVIICGVKRNNGFLNVMGEVKSPEICEIFRGIIVSLQRGNKKNEILNVLENKNNRS